MQLHLSQHLLAIDAATVLTGATRRPTAVILWTANGRPFRLTDGAGEQSWECRAAIVAPQFARSLQAVDCDVLSLNFEPGHPYYPWLASQAREKGVVPIEYRSLKSCSEDVRALVSSTDSDDLERIAASIVDFATPGSRPQVRNDGRIADVVQRIEAELSDPPSIPELARWVGLSADRLSHLFVEQIGVPARSYIVWRRWRKAAVTLQRLPDLTSVAHSVGYYDHAQMTRAFVGYFGYIPSLLRREEFFSVR